LHFGPRKNEGIAEVKAIIPAVDILDRRRRQLVGSDIVKLVNLGRQEVTSYHKRSFRKAVLARSMKRRYHRLLLLSPEIDLFF
jgi:hypothetical protein